MDSLQNFRRFDQNGSSFCIAWFGDKSCLQKTGIFTECVVFFSLPCKLTKVWSIVFFFLIDIQMLPCWVCCHGALLIKIFVIVTKFIVHFTVHFTVSSILWLRFWRIMCFSSLIIELIWWLGHQPFDEFHEHVKFWFVILLRILIQRDDFDILWQKCLLVLRSKSDRRLIRGWT